MKKTESHQALHLRRNRISRLKRRIKESQLGVQAAVLSEASTGKSNNVLIGQLSGTIRCLQNRLEELTAS